MLIGYMRVSTGEQNLDLQRDALDRAGCDRVFDDVCSGRATERAGLDKAIDIMRDGDTLVVWKLDRIGRSLPHVVGLVGDLQKRGVGLKVLTGDIDTTTVTGRLVFGIFATLAEFERDLIHERTMAGLAAARARGRSGGRPRIMTKQKLKAAMAMMADRDNAARDVAVQLGMSVSTLYAYVDAKGQPRERASELLGISWRCQRQWRKPFIRDTLCRRVSAANIGPNRFHHNRTVSWQRSMPRSKSRSPTFRSDSGIRIYIITTRRMTSGEDWKYQNCEGGLSIRAGYQPASVLATPLTEPFGPHMGLAKSKWQPFWVKHLVRGLLRRGCDQGPGEMRTGL